MKKLQIPSNAAGQRLSAYLAENHIPISADCGGRGVCGKCRVIVSKGTFYTDAACKTPLVPDENGGVLACRAFCSENGGEILLPDTDGTGLTDFSAGTLTASHGEGFGVALDIGTTTLAAALVDCSTAKMLSTVSRLNPQRSFGADVMSRITAAEEHLAEQQAVILDAAREMLSELSKKHPDCTPRTLTVSGNPTMLHLFCGVSPAGMGAYPFTPAFTELKTLRGADLSLPVDTVIVLPSASAFIGSDITAGAAILSMTENEKPSLLIDIGTNGEMLLSMGKANGGRIYAASAAAGPAMEGAGISCGVGGIPGAVCAVKLKDGTPTFETVGKKMPPVGICGSGLIDLIAALLTNETLDETGYLDDDPFVICDKGDGTELSLTQNDIRQFQLAKSAIRAGVEALLAHAGIEAEDVGTVSIAGGLGYYMNIGSAVRCGLLPTEFSEKAKAVGNTSLAGAAEALCDPSFTECTADIASRCETIELNSSAVFNEGFVEHMLFPEEDD